MKTSKKDSQREMARVAFEFIRYIRSEQLDPEFYQTLKQADIFIVLTQFISHLAMWETKAYAIENDVPIFFMKGVNIPRLLAEVAAKSKN